jgi:hypothetical protein
MARETKIYSLKQNAMSQGDGRTNFAHFSKNFGLIFAERERERKRERSIINVSRAREFSIYHTPGVISIRNFPDYAAVRTRWSSAMSIYYLNILSFF